MKEKAKDDYYIFPVTALRNILIKLDVDVLLNNINEWEENGKNSKGLALSMVNGKYFADFINSINHTEKSIVLFCFTASISSIIGQKRYAKTNKDMILSRAFGFQRSIDVEFDEEVPPLFTKYKKRYHWDKLFLDLHDRGILKYGIATRGFYLAYAVRIKLEDLIYIIEENRLKSKQKALRDQMQKARANALKRLDSS